MININDHWYKVLTRGVTGIEHRHHTIGAANASSASHGGAVGPRLMFEIDQASGGKMGDCEIFVDAGSGIGSVLGYVAKQYYGMTIFGLELEIVRVNAAIDLLKEARVYDDRRISISTCDITDTQSWQPIANMNNKKVCVWINSLNFEGETMCQLEQILSEIVKVEGGFVMTNKRMFLGRSRQAQCGHGLFKEEVKTIELVKGDLSWCDVRSMKLFIYWRK